MKNIICILPIFATIFLSCKDEWKIIKQQDFDKTIFSTNVKDSVNSLTCNTIQINNILKNDNLEDIDGVNCSIKRGLSSVDVALKNPFKINNFYSEEYNLDFNYKQLLGKETIYYTKSFSEKIEKSKNLGDVSLDVNGTKSGKSILKVVVKDASAFIMPKVKVCIYENQNFSDKLYGCQGSIDSTDTDVNGAAFFTGMKDNKMLFIKAMKVFSVNVYSP